jgi:tetratricopeptide (TPR) repeat protein
MLRTLSIFILLQLVMLASCSSIKKEKSNEKVADAANVVIPIVKEEVKDPALMNEEQLSALVDETLKKNKTEVHHVANDLFFKGTDLSMRGESELAAHYYKALSRLKPNDLFVAKKYAIELIRSGKLEESVVVLDKVFHEGYAKDSSTGLILAGVYTALEKKNKAQKIYKEILVLNPKSEEACVFLSKSYAADKKFSKADALLARCQKKMSKSPIFPYYRGKVALNQKREKRANQFFKQALKVDKTYHQAALGIGILLESQGKYEKAMKVYENFLEDSPMNYPVLTRVVQIKFQIKNYDGIIKYAERLIALDPSDLNLKVQLGILYSDKKQYDDAKGIFKEILVEVPNSDKVLFYLGALYKETINFEEAIVYFSKIGSESQLYFDSSVQIAQLLQSMIQMGQKEKKEEFVNFILSRSDGNENLKFKLGIMLATFYEGEQDYGRAIASLENLQSEKSYDSNHDYYLASLHDKNGNFVTARKLIEKILEENPNDAHALNFLGYSLLERNEEMEFAYECIKKAVELKPDDGYIRDSLGWFYYKTGRYELALAEMKKAWKLVGEDYIIAKHLAMAYEKVNELTKAKELYEEAIKLCQTEKEKEVIVDYLNNLERRRLPAAN